MHFAAAHDPCVALTDMDGYEESEGESDGNTKPALIHLFRLSRKPRRHWLLLCDEECLESQRISRSKQDRPPATDSRFCCRPVVATGRFTHMD